MSGVLLIGRSGLAVGALLVVTSTFTAVVSPPGTAESVISALTVGIGVLVVVLGLLALLLERKRHE
ncbi:hypothetical protein [Nocardiopsis kunsanensis]|uniref:Uncharacterized protein n=1 Tax=Nocardiopsis kunsanensis TaxID=141693 RepID=A0A918XAA7_9ACTN|nr:hypothetical protein [Nocardiopsis kunsanensis]GHD21261.1 hypothetical protein GCM10007147_14460 [Nocardiopsis kunsanensis]